MLKRLKLHGEAEQRNRPVHEQAATGERGESGFY